MRNPDPTTTIATRSRCRPGPDARPVDQAAPDAADRVRRLAEQIIDGHHCNSLERRMEVIEGGG